MGSVATAVTAPVRKPTSPSSTALNCLPPLSRVPSARKRSSVVNWITAYETSRKHAAGHPTYRPRRPRALADLTASNAELLTPTCSRALMIETGTRTHEHTTPVATEAICDWGSLTVPHSSLLTAGMVAMTCLQIS
eukprot:3773082-Pleurochrysis_carterae.AAC.6